MTVAYQTDISIPAPFYRESEQDANTTQKQDSKYFFHTSSVLEKANTK
jgi:hypothetical protein